MLDEQSKHPTFLISKIDPLGRTMFATTFKLKTI